MFVTVNQHCSPQPGHSDQPLLPPLWLKPSGLKPETLAHLLVQGLERRCDTTSGGPVVADGMVARTMQPWVLADGRPSQVRQRGGRAGTPPGGDGCPGTPARPEEQMACRVLPPAPATLRVARRQGEQTNDCASPAESRAAEEQPPAALSCACPPALADGGAGSRERRVGPWRNRFGRVERTEEKDRGRRRSRRKKGDE